MLRVIARISILLMSLGTIGGLAAAQAPKPTCTNCPGYYIPKEEVDAYAKRARETIGTRAVVDQQIRAIDAGKSNVDVGLVYRPELLTPGPDTVAEHDQVSEVYHIIEGTATLVTGPDIIGAKRRPADDPAVRALNGPGSNGSTVRNGTTFHLKPGDVVIIPAGTGHWFTRIDDHILYLMVRIDPDKVTPRKDEAASRADLAGK